MPDLTQLLRRVGEAQNNPQLPGPLNAIPQPIRAGLGVVAPLVPGIGALATPGGQVGQALARPIADNIGGQAIFGAGVARLGQIGQILQSPAGPAFSALAQTTPLGPIVNALQAAQAVGAHLSGADPLPALQAAAQADTGGVQNPLALALASGEAAKSKATVRSQVGQAALDPLNFVGGAGELAQASKLGRVGDLLTAVDRAQNLPVEALGALARQGHAAAKLRLLREVTGNVADEALPVVGGKKQLGPIRPPEQFGYARGNVPGDQLVPKVGRNGGKGVGPILPPELGPPAPETPPATQPVADLLNAARKSAQPNPLEQLIGAGRGTAAREVRPRQTLTQIEAAVPKAAPKAAIPARPTELFPLEAVTPGQEAAAKAAVYGPVDRPAGIPQSAPPDLPGYQGQTRQQALAALDSDEIDNLLSVAYGHENGVANALLKRRDPIDLADRAIERITTSRTKAGLLQQAYPDLAEKIAFLPDPEEALANVDIPVAPTDPAERAAWQARYVGQSQAGTDILAAGDKVAGGDLTQADLNALSPQERMAALRKLAAEPAPAPNVADVADVAATSPAVPTLEEYARSIGEWHDNALDAPLTLKEAGQLNKETGSKTYKRGDTPNPAAQMWLVDNKLRRGKGMASSTAIAQYRARFGGGDLAAGGGGFGLLPTRGGLGAANRAIGGALAGGAVGGAAGALASPDDRLGGAAKGAAAGALLGGNLGAGAGLLESRLAQQGANSAGHPLLAHAWDQAKVEQAAANAASGNLWSAIKNLPAVWRRNVTEHPKNLLGDEGWGRTVLQGAQGAGSQALLRQVRDEAAGRLKAATPWERLPQTTQATMAALGREGQVPDLGSSFHNAESTLTRKVISTSDQMIGSGILSLANPAAVAQNLVGAGGSVALGAVRPGWHGFFQAVNHFQQETFRQAAFADEAATGLRLAAERFLPDLEAAGVDISRLAPDGSFGVKDVHAVAGQAAADRWRAYGDAIYDSATRRVKFLFGDFSKRSGIEKALGGPIPFTSWLIRAYPVALSLLAQHPAVALAAYQYMRLTSQGAGQDGRPGYTAGMIPVDDQTPILGALVRLYTQGAGGKGYLDPVGGISPVGGEMFQPAEDDSQKNWYQKGTALLGRLGLPGVNPAIQAGAYVAGLDYKAPGALSRTQGLENAAALLPGNPQLPDVAGGLLRAARGSVSQATAAAGLPGAQADKTPVAYDPITRRYAELVFAATGKPLGDQANQAYLLAMGDPENALMQQARREVLLGGAAKNVGSLTSPVGVIGQSGENAQYRAAKVGEPFSAARIAGSSPGVQQLMQAGNKQYRQATPASQIYTVGNREQGAYSLLDQFEADPQVRWLEQYAPKSYQMQRDELMIRLGLKEPPKAPRQNPYLPAGR